VRVCLNINYFIAEKYKNNLFCRLLELSAYSSIRFGLQMTHANSCDKQI